MSNSNSNSNSNSKGLTSLPVNFVPGAKHIVTNAKRAKALDHPGNRWMRSLVKSYLPKYVKANGRGRRAIIATVIKTIEAENGWFVCQKRGGRWFAVDRTIAREKVTMLFQSKLQRLHDRGGDEAATVCSTRAVVSQEDAVLASCPGRWGDCDDKDTRGGSSAALKVKRQTSSCLHSREPKVSVDNPILRVAVPQPGNLNKLESQFQSLLADPTRHATSVNDIMGILSQNPQYCLHPFQVTSPNQAVTSRIPPNAFLGSVKSKHAAVAIPLKIFLILGIDLAVIQTLCQLNLEALMYQGDSCLIPIHLALELKMPSEVVLFLANTGPQDALMMLNEFYCTPVKVALQSHFYPNTVVASLIELCPGALEGSWGLHGGSAVATALYRNLGSNVVKLLIEQMMHAETTMDDHDHDLVLSSTTSSNHPQLRACDGSLIYVPLIINLDYAQQLVKLLPKIQTLHLECANWTEEGMNLFLKHLQSDTTTITDIGKLTLSFGLLGNHNQHLLQGWCQQGRTGLQRLHLARCERDTGEVPFINDTLLNAIACGHPTLEELEIDARLPSSKSSTTTDDDDQTSSTEFWLPTSVQTVLRRTPRLKSLTLHGIKCDLVEICQALQHNRVLHTLVIPSKEGPEAEELDSYCEMYSDLLSNHNTTLQKLELGSGGGWSPHKLKEVIDYHLKVNEYLRSFATRGDPMNPPPKFMELLMAFPYDDKCGLLRQLPEVWCCGIRIDDDDDDEERDHQVAVAHGNGKSELFQRTIYVKGNRFFV